MALVPCPECGSDVSTTAAFCPRCGFRRPARRGRPALAPQRGWWAALTVLAYVLLGGSWLIGQGVSTVGGVVITLALATVEIRWGLLRRLRWPGRLA